MCDVLAAEGFALGGGLAMRAHGIIDRETQDIDAFRRDPILSQPEAFDRAEKGLQARLAEAGLRVEKVFHQDFGRRFEVTDLLRVTQQASTSDGTGFRVRSSGSPVMASWSAATIWPG